MLWISASAINKSSSSTDLPDQQIKLFANEQCAKYTNIKIPKQKLIDIKKDPHDIFFQNRQIKLCKITKTIANYAKNNDMPQIWKVIKTLRKNPFKPISELYINQHNKTSATCTNDILQRQKHTSKKTSILIITSPLLTSNPSLKIHNINTQQMNKKL